MSRKNAAEVVEEAAQAAVNSEAGAYVKRFVEDPELRETVGRALDSSRRAYERVAKARKPGKLLEDKKLQADVQEALAAFRDAAVSLTGEAQGAAKRGRRRGRKLLLVVVGGGVALVASEDLRSKLLDTLFGAEEEFQYTPPADATEAAAPAPAPVDAPPANGEA
jgi:hypothetical protein